METSRSPAVAVPLAAALIFPFGDFIVKAYSWGAQWESYATVVRPLAFFVGLGLALVAFGCAGGFLLGPFSAVPRRIAVMGGGAGGAVTAALIIRTYVPFAAFDTPLRQVLLWSAVWAVVSWVLTLAAVGLAARPRLFESVQRAVLVAPVLLAAVMLYQLLPLGAEGQQWAVLPAVAAGLAAFLRRGAVYVNAALALGVLVSPLLGPVEPALAIESKVIGLDASAHDPAHVIFISVDTLRADELAFYGGAALTPNLDRLAADSLVFEHALSTSTWTLPALTGLHYGVSPWVHGVWSETDPVPTEPLSLAERFSEAGYATGKIGSNAFITRSFKGPSLSQGFQTVAEFPIAVRPRTNAVEFLDMHGWIDLKSDATTGELTGWASEWAELNRDKPFFLWLHVFDPHGPYEPPAEFVPAGTPYDPQSSVGDPEIRPKSPDEAEQMHNLYRGEISYVDDRIGRFLGALRDLGIYDDALIAFVSDHGEEFFEHEGFGHGHTMYQELLRVPLLIKLPRSAKTGRIEEPVSTLGFAPTLLSLANIDYDPGDFSAEPIPLDGKPSGGPMFAAGSVSDEPLLAVVYDGLKLVKRRGFDSLRLYDLEADPEERIDLATQRPDDVRRGLELLQQHREQADALRDRLGIQERAPVTYGPAEEKLLRSLGYLN